MKHSQSTTSNSFKLILRAAALLFVSIFIIRLVVYVLGASYDWDIDHEMYFGSRLLEGELLYTREQHDKLPFVQFLFALPAALGSVSYWVVISGLFAITASAYMFMAIKQVILDDWPSSNRRIAVEIALFGSTFYLFLISVMPGSITVISTMAASMALLAISLQLIYSRHLRINTLNSVITYGASAILAVLSISIRPYLAPPLVLLGLWIPLRRRAIITSLNLKTDSLHPIVTKRENILIGILRYALIWSVSLLTLGLIINISPYIITNNIDKFAKGILLSSQQLNPQSTLTNITFQISTLIDMGNAAFMLTSIALIVPCFVLFNRIRSYRETKSKSTSTHLLELDIIYSGIIPIFLIETAILGRHFWPHYQQLFAPYIALSLTLAITYVYNNDFVKVKLKGTPIAISLLIIISLILFMRYEIAKSPRNFTKPHAHYLYSEYVKELVKDRKKQGLPADFLHVNSMYFHWKLGESRHGFPSAANIEHINWGWWAKLDKNETNNLYTTSDELCQAFQKKGPTLIFIERNSLSFNCLSSPGTFYNESGGSPEVSSNEALFIRK